MHPILIDFSRWEPFGISLAAPMAKALAIVVLLVLAFTLGNLWDRRAKSLAVNHNFRKWYADWQRIVMSLAGVAIALGFVWVVGRVFTYGAMVALGFIFGGVYARRRFRKTGLNPAILNNLVMICLIAGIAGARLTYIIYNFNEFTSPYLNGAYRTPMMRFVEMLKISQGGLVFDGGVTLAFVAILIYIWRKRLPMRRILDIMSVALMIGLSFGRVGCYFNGCCYGEACRADWALGVDYPYSGQPVVYPHDEHDSPWPDDATPSLVYSHQFARERDLDVPDELVDRLPDGSVRLKMPAELQNEAQIDIAEHSHALSVHPVQLYAVANAALISLLLAMLLRVKHRDGQIFTLMLVFYGLTRFIMEVIRDDNPDMAITTAQYKCMVMAIAGVIGFVIFSRRAENTEKLTAAEG